MITKSLLPREQVSAIRLTDKAFFGFLTPHPSFCYANIHLPLKGKAQRVDKVGFKNRLCFFYIPFSFLPYNFVIRY